MPLEWKTTNVETPIGAVKITHLAKHDPRLLLRAVTSKPKYEVEGASPALMLHDFGMHALAVRDCKNEGVRHAGNDYDPPREIFEVLRSLVHKRRALVEMPIALVEKPTGRSLLVTLWKKDSRPLNRYLADKSIPLNKRVAASFEFIRQLAKLHALGFVHGHPYARNAVVNKNGSVQLIDPTLLHKVDVNYPFDYDFGDAAESVNKALSATGEFSGDQLEKIYVAHSQIYEHTRAHPNTIVKRVPKLTGWRKVKAILKGRGIRQNDSRMENY